MMGTLGKGDKSVIQRKFLFQFYNNGFISISNSEQEEQTNREKYVFYFSVSQIHINPEKKHEKPYHNDCLNILTISALVNSHSQGWAGYRW